MLCTVQSSLGGLVRLAGTWPLATMLGIAGGLGLLLAAAAAVTAIGAGRPPAPLAQAAQPPSVRPVAAAHALADPAPSPGCRAPAHSLPPGSPPAPIGAPRQFTINITDANNLTFLRTYQLQLPRGYNATGPQVCSPP